MRWRPGHLAFLVFQALWLNVILPGHTRGSVTLAGADCESCAAALEGPHAVAVAVAGRCCSTSPAPRQHQNHPTPKQKANCAICAFAARVTPPPPVTLVPSYAGCAIALPTPAPRIVVSLERIPTYYGNGPPPAAA
jgi:hypothetical protein